MKRLLFVLILLVLFADLSSAGTAYFGGWGNNIAGTGGYGSGPYTFATNTNAGGSFIAPAAGAGGNPAIASIGWYGNAVSGSPYVTMAVVNHSTLAAVCTTTKQTVATTSQQWNDITSFNGTCGTLTPGQQYDIYFAFDGGSGGTATIELYRFSNASGDSYYNTTDETTTGLTGTVTRPASSYQWDFAFRVGIALNTITPQIAYLDGLNGSDSNNGSTPALAKQTVGGASGIFSLIASGSSSTAGSGVYTVYAAPSAPGTPYGAIVPNGQTALMPGYSGWSIIGTTAGTTAAQAPLGVGSVKPNVIFSSASASALPINNPYGDNTQSFSIMNATLQSGGAGNTVELGGYHPGVKFTNVVLGSGASHTGHLINAVSVMPGSDFTLYQGLLAPNQGSGANSTSCVYIADGAGGGTYNFEETVLESPALPCGTGVTVTNGAAQISILNSVWTVGGSVSYLATNATGANLYLTNSVSLRNTAYSYLINGAGGATHLSHDLLIGDAGHLGDWVVDPAQITSGNLVDDGTSFHGTGGSGTSFDNNNTLNFPAWTSFGRVGYVIPRIDLAGVVIQNQVPNYYNNPAYSGVTSCSTTVLTPGCSNYLERSAKNWSDAGVHGLYVPETQPWIATYQPWNVMLRQLIQGCSPGDSSTPAKTPCLWDNSVTIKPGTVEVGTMGYIHDNMTYTNALTFANSAQTCTIAYDGSARDSGGTYTFSSTNCGGSWSPKTFTASNIFGDIINYFENYEGECPTCASGGWSVTAATAGGQTATSIYPQTPITSLAPLASVAVGSTGATIPYNIPGSNWWLSGWYYDMFNAPKSALASVINWPYPSTVASSCVGAGNPDPCCSGPGTSYPNQCGPVTNPHTGARYQVNSVGLPYDMTSPTVRTAVLQLGYWAMGAANSGSSSSPDLNGASIDLYNLDSPVNTWNSPGGTDNNTGNITGQALINAYNAAATVTAQTGATEQLLAHTEQNGWATDANCAGTTPCTNPTTWAQILATLQTFSPHIVITSMEEAALAFGANGATSLWTYNSTTGIATRTYSTVTNYHLVPGSIMFKAGKPLSLFTNDFYNGIFHPGLPNIGVDDSQSLILPGVRVMRIQGVP